ncbi:IS5 family transposase [Brucella pituitosa]|uniref:IS5 family transposase n=1 Tax=Brucella pituitosa TaxID=571256 RepID=A0A643ESB0_9HYPH|nr:IS5 family transposase [Brucella pituitosa]
MHLKTDRNGQPLGFELTGGEASDSKQFESLMETGPQVRHRAIIADKGYDSDVNRETARKAGAIPVIPYRSNRRNIPKHFATALYRGRARIEQMMGKLKRFKRVALRCEKTARNFRSIVAIAAAFILINSVHTA